jgi:hypothetical protein
MDKQADLILGLYFALYSVGYVVFSIFQPVLDYSSCPLCDGNFYIQIYQSFKSGQIQIPKPPFQSRFLIPALAAFFPFGTKITFWILHYLLGWLSVWMVLRLWQKLELSAWVKHFAIAWLVLHWVGVFRHNLWDFIAVDSPVIAIHAYFLVILVEKKYHQAYLLVVLGIFVKESIVPLLLAGFMWAFFVEKRISSYHLLIAAIVGLVLLLGLQTYLNATGANSVRIALSHAKELLFNPLIFLKWAVALFWAYGLGLYFIKKEGLFFWFSIFYLGLGLLGGRDATRILFLGFPFTMTAIVLGLNAKKNYTLAITALLSLPTLRLFEPFPTQYGSAYLNFFPESANGYAFVYFCVYPIFGWVLLWLLKNLGYKN